MILRFLSTALIAAVVVFGPAAAMAEPVRFVVFGDTQDTSPDGLAKVRTLTGRINRLQPDFTVHIGDIKGGGPCSDAFFEDTRALLARIDSPLVYLPGDNEWTDCHMPSFGGSDPIDRLAALRRIFFAPGLSLGADPMPLAQQWNGAASDRAFIENARWRRGGVLFASFHLVGSNNNLRQDRAAVAEHFERDEANLAWLEASFAQARAQDTGAMVLFFHANPAWNQNWWQPTGFDRFRTALVAQARQFARPVLVIHGDTHTFRIDKPIRADGPPVDTITRLEVFGPPETGAIEVTVDPDAEPVFGFRPFTVTTPD